MPLNTTLNTNEFIQFMDPDKLIPIFAALTTAVAGLVVWVFQKNRERQDQVRQRKQAVYESLLIAIAELPSHNAAPLFVESQLAGLYASDKVLHAMQVVFSSFQVARPFEERAEVLGALLFEMRKDIFSQTKVTEASVRTIFEMGHPPVEDLVKYIERRGMKLKSQDGK